MSKISTAIAGRARKNKEGERQQKNCEWTMEMGKEEGCEEGENDELLECPCRNQKGNLSQKCLRNKYRGKLKCLCVLQSRTRGSFPLFRFYSIQTLAKARDTFRKKELKY